MFRRTIAGAILGPALLVGSLAWSGFLALRTVLDPDRSQEVAEELLDNEEVRAQLTANLGRAIEAALPDDAPVSGEVIDDAAATVLDDPRVEALIIDAFGSTHRAFLGEGEAPESLDLTPVIAPARASLEAASPGLAELLPESQAFVVDLPTEHIPDASPVRRFLQNAVPYLAAISAVGVLLALVSTTDRPSILRRAARWALGTTAVYLIVGLGIPWVLRQIAPDQAEVVAALLGALLRSTLVPSIMLAASGAALLVAAAVWPEGARRPARARAPDPTPTPYPAQPQPMPYGQSGAHGQPMPYGQSGAHGQPMPYGQSGAHGQPMPYGQSGAHGQPGAYGQSGAHGQPITYAPPHPGTGQHPAAAPDPATGQHPPAAPAPAPPIAAPEPFGDPLPNAPAMPATPAAPPGPIAGGPPRPGPPRPGPTRPRPARPGPGDVAPGQGRATFRTREGPGGPARPPADATSRDGRGERWLPPRWVEGHGWVLDPDDPKPPPPNSTWVEGVGYVVPGPPPTD